jgi:hypothetical protein
VANSGGPNPVRLVADHLPGHIAELEAALVRAVAKVRDIQLELATARTLLAVAPPEEKP